MTHREPTNRESVNWVDKAVALWLVLFPPIAAGLGFIAAMIYLNFLKY